MEITEEHQNSLRECPFCGSKAELKQTGKKALRIRCKSCLMGIEQHVLKYSLEWLRDKLIEKWNTRIYIGQQP